MFRPGGSSIQAVGSTGSVVCNAGPAAFSAFDDDTGTLCNTLCAEGALSVPAGLYSITAQITDANGSRPVSGVAPVGDDLYFSVAEATVGAFLS